MKDFTEEKFEEYKQMAALAMLALDEIIIISKYNNQSKEDLIKYIKMKRNDLENFINDSDKRKSIYNANLFLFNLSKRG